ncbi:MULTISPECIES: AraC family transcriptional regulator [unclassified Pseudonocardia]|uniref:AraC family transcriptional regulator n=1 Tax=unclassified Pseudonocardia TaxID=2619320 RepID=UPI000760E05C|nr:MULTISPECIES: AraC family transcriptional regulator [unclassified Pseudonocardia]
MTEPVTSPVSRFDVRSSDPEYSHEVLRATYTDFAVRTSRNLDDFRLALTGVRTGDVVLARTRYGAAAEMGVPPQDRQFHLATYAGGRVCLRDGREIVTPGLGTPTMLPRREITCRLADVDVRTVSLTSSLMDRAARSAFGTEAPPTRFTSTAPVSPEAARYWQGVVAHLRDDVLGDDAVAANPLVLAEATRALATATLVVFPNVGLARAGERADAGGRADPAVLRRALAYIDEHAGEDIGVDDIAAAARIGVRGLQHMFRRHRRGTPLEELRRVRMARAHADLRAADPTSGDTVGSIAARWGFAHSGRFSVEYRHAYGCSPSATLRR